MSSKVLDVFVEDDADEMVSIIESVFQDLAVDYLLNKKEAENITESLKKDLSGKFLKDMYASSSRRTFAKTLLVKHIELETNKREKISLPSNNEMQNGLRNLLEELSDEESL